MKEKRIVYVQYTNPAAYPPLEHSSRILAARGWQVLFLGAGAVGSAALRFRESDRIRVAQLRFQSPGWRQKLHYLYFHAWCAARALAWRADWIYCSDTLSAPFGWMMSALGARVIYHEHDSPSGGARGGFERLLLKARRGCARRAGLCVLPNAARAMHFLEACGVSHRPAVVWNCPVLREVSAARSALAPGTLRLLYHGSIVPERLPLSVIDAIAMVEGRISLTIVGYETGGSKGYLDRLRARALELRIEDRIHTRGTLATREELLKVCREHDAGFALMPAASGDLNLRAMEGASNKPFDYLACGLALIVSRLPAWEEIFVAPGYGHSCDPTSAEDIARVLHLLLQDSARTRAMGQAGRQRVLSEWNYEYQFRPVLEFIEDAVDAAPARERSRAAEARG